MKEVKLIQLDKKEIDTCHTWGGGDYNIMGEISDGDIIFITDHKAGSVIPIYVITVLKETEDYFFLIIEE
mgnify:CR=1 FL=1|jgi:hypothetical protein